MHNSLSLTNIFDLIYNYLYHTLLKKSKRIYRCRQDVHDERDYYIYWISKNIKDVIDLRNQCPVIYDQGQLGSCTANAICAAYQFDEIKDYNSSILPSRLFLYYNERKMEGTVNYDSGASLRDGMKSVASDGICNEKYWPYDINKYKISPTEICYENATKNKTIQYTRLYQNLSQLQNCLSNGYPFVFGIKVYESFESDVVASTGYVPLPNVSKEKLLGGHALLAVGYDNTSKHFIVRNSWSSDWGDEGYCYIPYEYMLNRKLAHDFWYIGKITKPSTKIYTISYPPVFC